MWRIKRYLFEPRFRFSRFQFNLVGIVFLTIGITIGSYFTLYKILPNVFAINDSSKIWTFTSDNHDNYTYTASLVTVDGTAYPITGINKIINPSFTTDNSSWTLTAVNGSTTPAGWSVVPGDVNYVATNSAFLAMKYEAKYDCTATPDGDGDTAATCSAPADSGSGLDYRDISGFTTSRVVSTANGAPIVHISQLQAQNACPTGYHLISNNESMAIARNAELVSSNWAGGKGVGSLVSDGGGLKRGNVGNTDSVGYIGATPEYGTGRNTKAQLTLSNGESIWDLSGNVWEWNSDTILATNKPHNNTADWAEWTAFTPSGASTYGTLSYLYTRPLGNTYNSTYGVGKYYEGTNTGVLSYGFLRGGNWGATTYAGAFALYLHATSDSQGYNSGFRCASAPVAISQSFSSSSGRSAGGNIITIGPTLDGRITQSINVGDTSPYDFSVYVKNTDNSAVDTNTAQLYYGGNTITSPAWTSVGSNWYKLTGIVTGVASPTDTGIIVKSGKTVVTDDFTLSKHDTTNNFSIYNKTAPTVTNHVTTWDSFAATVTASGLASVSYQLCLNDGSACSYTTGSRWQYYSSGAWHNATDTTQTNTVAELNQTDVATGKPVMQLLDATSQKISFKAVMAFGGSDTPAITSITIGLTTDITPPNNTTSVTMKKSVSGTTMSANGWSNNSSPYFTWPTATDNLNPDGSAGSGVKGYCLYIAQAIKDDDNNYPDPDPNLTTGVSSYLPANEAATLDSVHISSANTECGNGGGFLVSSNEIDFSTTKYRGTAASPTKSWLSSSNAPYYLYVKTVDNAGKIATGANVSFHFRFDNTAPANPSYLSVPGDWIATKSATLLWSSSGADGPTDANSQVTGLQYRIGAGGIWYGDAHNGMGDNTDLLVNDGTYTTQEAYDYTPLGEGSNIIYLRTWDNAGNVSDTYISGALKINTTAPSAPRNLAVTATTPKSGDTTNSETNLYSFAWDDPSAFTGQASNLKFCYTVNTVPTFTTCTYTASGANTLSADAFATQPGTNTLYLATKDEAGNINYASYASVEFTYSGSAPGIPRNVDVADISIKATSNWKLAVSWDAPSSVGAGVTSYKIYRSTINTTCSDNPSSFTQIGTTAGSSYSDTGLSQSAYYYCVKACDSAANCSAASSTVSKTPTGKYFSAASLTSGPTAGSITTKKATITWSTDRNSDSKISYGTSTNSYGSVEPSNSSQVTSHTLQLTGLNPGTTYYYKAKWTDEDGNTGNSDEKTISTDAAPTVKDVAAKNIGLNGTIIQFTSKGSSKVKIYYGTTTGFGGSKEVSTSTTETTYTSELTGLEDGTKYYYKLNTFDSESGEYEGTILDFTTLPRPKISSVRIQEVKGTAQPTILVSWISNTEVSSIVTYYPEGKASDARDEVNISLTTGEHKMFIKGLFPQTNYILVVRGRDKIGNEATSDTQRVTTATDTRPPSILNVSIEGGVVPPVGGAGQESIAQLVVSWDTDEPGTSQVEFGEGTGDTYAQKTQEDSNLTMNHLVVMSNLTPSKVYHLRTISKDKAGNEGKSIDSVTITPKSTQSALDLVIGNLSEVFGFLQNVNR